MRFNFIFALDRVLTVLTTGSQGFELTHSM